MLFVVQTKTARSPRKSEKREHLIRTAFRLFNEHGYHAVGIDTILAEAGVAKMTLYNHFESKDELIVAALEYQAAVTIALREKALSEAGADPFRQIEAIFDCYEAWFRTDTFKGCAFIRAAGEYPDHGSPIHAFVQRQKRKMIELIEGICTRAKARNPEQLAQQIYLLAEGSIVRAHTFNAPEAAELAKQAALTLLDAATTPPEPDLPSHLL